VSGATFFRDEGGTLTPFWRFAFIVAIFLLVWPPICGVVVWWVKLDSGPAMLAWLAAAVIYAYLFCVPSALVAGIMHAVAALSFRHNSILVHRRLSTATNMQRTTTRSYTSVSRQVRLARLNRLRSHFSGVHLRQRFGIL